MADDRMRNDDLERNMGAGQNKENIGQQSPGRKQDQDDDLRTGQRGAHEGRGGQQQNEPHEDDFGTPGNKGTGQGQKRGNL